MTAEERTKTIEKVKKLLALSTSNHEGEAKLAMEKAGQILAQTGLTMAEVTEQKTEESQLGFAVTVEQADRTGWLGNLAGQVAKAFDCRSLRGRGTNTRSHRMIFVGFKKDVDMAVHFFSYLKRQVDILAREYERANGRGYQGRMVDAFRIGVVRTVGRRLREMFEARVAVSDCTALVVVKTEKVQEFMSKRFRTSLSRAKTQVTHVNAYNRGKEAGENVHLRRPIEGSAAAAGQIQ